MANLELSDNELVFRFPEVHAHAELRINLQRTLRIPDDGKSYPLPPGLGRFPVVHVDDHKDRVPASWREHGGVCCPVFQAEALWIAFERSYLGGPVYPFAVRVAAGKINAVSGDGWSDVMVPGDHLVTPPQPWLDGFAVEKGKIRQFVATPLGMGLTVEQQLTGKEEHGGIQIEVRPLKAAEYEKILEKHRQASLLRGGQMRSGGKGGQSVGGGYYGSYGASGMSLGDLTVEASCYNASLGSTKSLGAAEMGLGAGGLMDQQVFEDTFGIDAWDSAKSRVFLHLANSLAWQAITGSAPPPSPCTVEAYTRAGMPWFSHYVEGVPVADGGKNLKGVKTVKQMGDAKGIPILPTNESVSVPAEKVVKVTGSVRDGSW